MIKLYVGILIIGIAIGITGTMIARRCNMVEAMKPLTYALNELAGRGCR